MVRRANSAYEDARARAERVAGLISDDPRAISSRTRAQQVHTRSSEVHFARATSAERNAVKSNRNQLRLVCLVRASFTVELVEQYLGRTGRRAPAPTPRDVARPHDELDAPAPLPRETALRSPQRPRRLGCGDHLDHAPVREREVRARFERLADGRVVEVIAAPEPARPLGRP